MLLEGAHAVRRRLDAKIMSAAYIVYLRAIRRAHGSNAALRRLGAQSEEPLTILWRAAPPPPVCYRLVPIVAIIIINTFTGRAIFAVKTAF